MPWTEEEKQAEKERVTKISGFRVAAHDLLAEIDPDALKARNDRWEEEHGKMTRQQRMDEELQRAMVYVGAGKAPAHIAIHIHMAHECGATKEYLLNRMLKAAQWVAPPRAIRLHWRPGASCSGRTSRRSSRLGS
jgi:hypothetical protein